MDSGERALLTSTIDELVRSADGAFLTAALDEFGWLELLESDPELAISTVFSASGRFIHWSSALHDVMARQFVDLPLRLKVDSTVVAPLPRQLTSGIICEGRLITKGLLLQPRSTSSLIVVVPGDEGTYTVLAVPIDKLHMERRDGLNPAFGSTIVSGSTDDFRVLSEGADATQWWNETVAVARVSICYSLVALLVRMVEFAKEHASSRRQFGRPIGTFQAIRHRVADSLVASDAADAIVSAVWRSDNFELAAAVAKLVTSNAVKVVSTHVQQVLAGIGFTAEHEFHSYMKRAMVLDRLFGNSTDLAGSIGSELVSIGYAPRLFEL
jgi:hypothetical protein